MADVRTFNLPDLGEGLEEGDVVEWLVEVGDVVALNQEIVTVETAKAAVDVPVPFAGRIVERAGEPGDTLTVGEMLCRIDVDVDAGGVAADGADGGDGADVGDRGDVDYDTPGLGSGGKGSTGLDAEGEPQPLVGYGSSEEGGTGRRRRRGATAAAAAPEPVAREGRPLAKPPVRKLAKDAGVDLALVPGTGPEGSITREDLAAFVDRHAAPAAPTALPTDRPRPTAPEAPTLASAVAGEKPVPGFRGRTPGEVERVAGVRKRIIAKMEQSRRDIPHALAATDADVTELWRLRGVLTAQAREQGFDVRISPNAIVMRAAVLALRRFPTLNAVYDQQAGEIRLLEQVNLGVAVDTDRGLIVPNIKDAHTKSLLQLAIETNELAEKCRDGTATPTELTGGTFTTDNYGYFGNDDGNPIINAPEVGILGIGAMRERPWVVDGEVTVRRVCRFQLAFDHRVCDGGEAGRFVRYVADLCEEPSRILLHA
jgi:2-oxoisovalerate dehydrogenase E2 component (dihydrolipoyl transacylase)